jgi:hypothetical protein
MAEKYNCGRFVRFCIIKKAYQAAGFFFEVLNIT